MVCSLVDYRLKSFQLKVHGIDSYIAKFLQMRLLKLGYQTGTSWDFLHFHQFYNIFFLHVTFRKLILVEVWNSFLINLHVALALFYTFFTSSAILGHFSKDLYILKFCEPQQLSAFLSQHDDSIYYCLTIFNNNWKY